MKSQPKHQGIPFERAYRGDKAGKITLKGIPKFDSKYEEREWVKEHMAASFRYWGKLGFGEGVSGHITVRDPVLPDHYWMNPLGVHFSLMTKSKLVLMGPDGYVSPHGAQAPVNIAGYYIHTSIHKARPDVAAAAHCHSIYGKTWSVFGRPIECLQQDGCVFHDNLSVYQSYGGVVLAAEEGNNIAAALGPKNKACILQNHGLLTLGNTVDEAIYLFCVLEKQCQVQLLAEAAAANGIPKVLIGEEDAAFSAATEANPEFVYFNFQPEFDLLMEETNGAFLK
ncbi:arad-like aldolase/epimerase [Dendrothele bispora CBS 962.96]|uniref:Arad-like aldolase/epimerase n=1 Tax=Dendrothele bispora (strain CBS 962.96) TaxID=1314807 RepID=A0A4S8MTG2_DENBC|nr:arad-like aldolase/epimerase [Dendrothele bispora CBS 962.96]